jgi:methylmalonyl-CoA decarboxylase
MTYTLSQVTESIGTITLDHERRRNALSHALVEEVIAALRSFQEAKVRVVILRAKPGAKVFSAGHDIDELPESRRDPLGWDDPLRQLVREIENYPGPVIAMVEGGVWGGATETVFACDLRCIEMRFDSSAPRRVVAAPDRTSACEQPAPHRQATLLL